MRHDLGDLYEEALSHLGTAVVQRYATVLVNVNQCTGLIEICAAEADPHHHRGKRDSPLEDRAVPVELLDGVAARSVFGDCAQLVDQGRQDEILDGLTVVRDVAALCIKIDLADFDGVHLEMMCDIEDRTLDPNHTLRDSEPAKRGIRDGVGLASIRLDADMLQEIRVVAVKDSTVGHG